MLTQVGQKKNQYHISHHVGYPGKSLVVPGLLGTGIFSSHLVGHPGTSQVVPGLLGTFETMILRSHLVGHPEMTLVVSGLLGTLRLGFLALTLWDIPG